MQKLIVEPKYNNKKLSTFLYDHFNGLTSSTLHKALRKKDIRINNIRINEDCYIHEFDTITIFIIDDLLYKKIEFKKIYEDDNILIIDKPVSIEVVSESKEATLTSLLQKEYSYIKPCHRLDRNTTGLVLFAKNEDSLNILLNKFKNHEIKKNYHCTVIGKMPKTQDTLKSYLFKDNKKSIVYISDTPKKGYLEIITKYKVLSEDNKSNTSKLDVELITGRTHQIRAHLAYIGNPILGDGKYGINEINKKLKTKYQQLDNYKIEFSFTSDSGILNYLNKTIIKK